MLLARLFLLTAIIAGNSDDAMAASGIVLVLLCAGLISSLIGIGAGIIGLLHKDRRTALTILGLAANLLVFLAMCGIIGLAVAVVMLPE
jgi:hypothetical protein